MSSANTTSDPWADLVAMAQSKVAKAEAGDAYQARDVLKQAAVALREVLAGRIPDRERIEYLRFLLKGLELIEGGVKPARALGFGETGRPSTVAEGRDVWLFIAVGLAYQRLKNVAQAEKRVARKYRIGISTVQKAWQAYGALKGWRRADEE
jgi:hypothetical protein